MARIGVARFIGLALAVVLGAAPARAQGGGLWSYLSRYQLGIDYTSSYDQVDASYETAASAAPSKGCLLDEKDPTRQRCDVHMSGGASSGFGLFLQQAFKRKGTFYWNADVGFGARYLAGELTDEAAADSAAAGLPLRSLSFRLAALVVRPYLTVGVTPQSKLPDVLLSLGPSAQVAVGEVEVNDEREKVALATASTGLINGFFELEIVFWRFGDGALSVFTASDVSRGENGSALFPKDKDGMRDFRADFSRSVAGGVMGFGAKLVLNWP